jgi:2-polyprenyl-3-methyl-5-hydroxy-6-metoxy-1,4-benzoquinol methylase
VTGRKEYAYHAATQGWAHGYLLDPVLTEIDRIRPARVFEIGAGNGFVASRIAAMGIEVVAIEPSHSGVEIARQSFPAVQMHVGSAYDDLASQYGKFPVVISLEVVEHLMEPRLFAKTVFDLLEPGGCALISTPYHGYLKNVALALTGKMDAHFTALWDGGHIKFWSIRTLSALLTEAGLVVEKVVRVGRVPMLAKSMLVTARRPR